MGLEEGIFKKSRTNSIFKSGRERVGGVWESGGAGTGVKRSRRQPLVELGETKIVEDPLS
jgi:hypothetical protein